METMVLELYSANTRFANGGTDDYEGDLRVLIECQQKALVLGEYLESMGMDYSDIVEKFENYCNMIYDISENLDDTVLVMDHKVDIAQVLTDILKDIEEKIIEIKSIDIYDFRGLVDAPGEKAIVSKEINRLIDSCLGNVPGLTEGEEMYRPLVVGTY
jgi:Glu-tRNA(Gln) amidotransferase subunit E-like FAD-binding protein